MDLDLISNQRLPRLKSGCPPIEHKKENLPWEALYVNPVAQSFDGIRWSEFFYLLIIKHLIESKFILQNPIKIT